MAKNEEERTVNKIKRIRKLVLNKSSKGKCAQGKEKERMKKIINAQKYERHGGTGQKEHRTK
jgi:hypothetical protein